MAIRCFGRLRLAVGTTRAFDFSFFRAEDLAAVLTAVLVVALRAGDFFRAVVRLAAREVGFFLAIGVLPFRYRERLAHFKATRVWRQRRTRIDQIRSMQPEYAVDGA